MREMKGVSQEEVYILIQIHFFYIDKIYPHKIVILQFITVFQSLKCAAPGHQRAFTSTNLTILRILTTYLINHWKWELNFLNKELSVWKNTRM